MKVIKVDVRAPQVSFRRPLDLNFQRTLPLPPPTTMIGLAGAALGLSDLELWNDEKWKSLREVKVSALLNVAPGKAKDMITILKVKGGRIEQRSPYFRELLFNVEYSLLYGGDDELIDMLKEAFDNPFYPLSLGREDELIEIVDVAEIMPESGVPVFYGTILPGDIREMEIELPSLKDKGTLKIEPAIVENVPLGFKVQKGYRMPSSKKTMTFLPYSLKVNVKTGIDTAYKIDGRNFTWVNS